MKQFFALIWVLTIIIFCLGCQAETPPAQIAATTLPVYDFTSRLCQNTGISVTRLVTESVSCLHDYALSVSQVKAIEASEIVVLSGGGLEAFMEDVLAGKEAIIDSSLGIPLTHCEGEHHGDHHHEADPHFWLSPQHAMTMAINICNGLKAAYPEKSEIFDTNLSTLLSDLSALETYGKETLSTLATTELITFHDGFSYFAEAFDLTILKAIEEESGSEASAAELKELITLVNTHRLPAVFTERNGSVAAADVLAAETGAKIYSLDMAMSDGNYFAAMYHSIDTIKEALG